MTLNNVKDTNTTPLNIHIIEHNLVKRCFFSHHYIDFCHDTHRFDHVFPVLNLWIQAPANIFDWVHFIPYFPRILVV